MVSRLRLCRATQSASALASATVVIASTSTASYSPKIKVEVAGSKPSSSPKGFVRSPTIVFPGAVKTFTLSVVSCDRLVPAISGTPFDVRVNDCSRQRLAREALAVGEIGALSDFDNVSVRIADVAAYLAVLGDWLGEELGSSAFP